jgi:Protein of unknown function (DUF3014)
MPDSWDHKLLRTEEPPELSPPRRQVGLWIIAGLLVVAAVVATYVVFGGRSTSERTTAAAPPSPVKAPQPIQPLGGDALPIDVPPLDETDALVRTLVKQLSSHPQVAAWLATEGRIRNFAVVVANIAQGKTPAALLRTLRPSSPFRVVAQGDDLYLDPRTYERYAGLADAVASVDPAGGARLYATLKPRIEEAHRELGYPDIPFDRALERAIVLLLETPVQDGALRVEPRGIVYGFADEELEDLTAAQKQLLRMGPRNARVVQRALRSIALALGIPSERLPASEQPDRR